MLLPLILMLAAGDTVVEAGRTLTLAEDLVLQGADSLAVRGTAEQRCTIVGNGHSLRTGDQWTGKLRISFCDLKGLGSPKAPSIDARASGRAEIALDGCDFDECGPIALRTDDASEARVTKCLLRENSTVSVDKAREKSFPVFVARGSSTSPKVFQGNRVYKSHLEIDAPNWQIEDNLLIGWRSGVFAFGAATVVKGNYIHVLMPRTAEFPWWSQVASFTTAKGALAEHNVIRDGEWIVQFVEGEFRNNVICDINDHNFLRNGSTGRIHHNIFFAGKPDHPPGSQSACIFVVYAPKAGETGVEVFNNVFDANGLLNVPGVEVNPNGFVKSVRSNAFVRFNHQEKYIRHEQAMYCPQWEEPHAAPPPPRLGYVDYNLYYSPTAKTHRLYALGVSGKAEKDDGFGKHDHVEIDPKFKGPLPTVFPFDDVDIKAGKVTVAQMLARFREIYTPAEGSPLIDAGDPADGTGTDIGAVNAGK
ncbi:MAG TPA: hypothetical protein VE981_02675 [Planctomycetota bacterium]|nr:hypothetical protein [Planctomycetota bacterium]